jgi:hypothetical protein
VLSKASAKGVLLGGITDVVSTNILAIPLVIYVMVKFDLVNSSKEQAQAHVIDLIHASPSLFATQLVIGVGCSMLGGYVAARIAKRDELLNGFLSSYLCLAIGIYSLAVGKGSGSLLLKVTLLVLAPGFGLLGGYLRQKQKRSDQHSI